MISREILRKLLEIEDLPTLPQVMNQILDTVEDDHSSSEDLTRVLECDHAISARILRVANSAFYGLPARVDSIRRAVVLVGFDTVRMLALATSVFDAFSVRSQKALDPQEFWMHSFGSAKTAQILTNDYCRVENPAACFTGALLHDIGKFLLALVMEEEYEKICHKALETGRNVCEIEREVLETTHDEIGAWLAEKWLFPPAIITMIRRRSSPPGPTDPYSREVAVIALSDVVSRAAGFGLACSPEVKRTTQGLSDNLNLDRRKFLELIEELEAVRSETEDLLQTLSES